MQVLYMLWVGATKLPPVPPHHDLPPTYHQLTTSLPLLPPLPPLPPPPPVTRKETAFTI